VAWKRAKASGVHRLTWFQVRGRWRPETSQKDRDSDAAMGSRESLESARKLPTSGLAQHQRSARKVPGMLSATQLPASEDAQRRQVNERGARLDPVLENAQPFLRLEPAQRPSGVLVTGRLF